MHYSCKNRLKNKKNNKKKGKAFPPASTCEKNKNYPLYFAQFSASPFFIIILLQGSVEHNIKKFLTIQNMMPTYVKYIQIKTMKQPEKTRKIIHIDMDCFYAAVEIRDNPQLTGLPVAVGGLRGNRGVICAANYEARKYGIRSALPSALALQKCPHLKLISPDIKRYARESEKIHKVFQNFTDTVEPLSLDEAYLDLSNSPALQNPLFKGSATLVAAEIRKEIFKATGLTASAGIAPNKFLAKIASDWKKPDGQFTIDPAMIDTFIKDLPVEKIWGVGKVTAKKMHEMEILYCRDLQKISLKKLITLFGKFGYELYNFCRGIDNREIITSRERKSVSIERTFEEDLSSIENCLDEMPSLYEIFQKRYQNSVEQAPLSHGHETQRKSPFKLFVKIKFSDFTATTIESSFEKIEIDHFSSLLKQALERAPHIKENKVRLLGVGVKFHPDSFYKHSDPAQLDLFS